MLTHPTLEKLHALRFAGMALAFEEQLRTPDIAELGFEERLGFLVDREMTVRDDRRLKIRLRKARLPQNACVEDINYRHRRGLDRSLMQSLIDNRWISHKQNLLITGKTGVGKSWLASALAHKACRDGFSAYYARLPRLLGELEIARGDGRYIRLLASYARIDLLVLDDWGLAPLTDAHRRDLLEILEDRHKNRSTIVTSQLPVDSWHEYIGEPTLADAILDRLVHNAHRLSLTGESMRKKNGGLTADTRSE
ncbi:MAG: IS21-like element helper ATPase IstB [Deinococcales bacterium]|jgi:DNA replication protein DnaC